jgi:hypothetical protein
MAHRIGEDRAQQPDRATGGAFAAAHPRQSTRFCFHSTGCLALGDSMHEPLDILSRHGSHRHAPELRLDMPFDPAPVCGEAGENARLRPARKALQ